MEQFIRRPFRTTSLETRAVILIVIGFVGLALGFSTGPIFEGPDEIEHYRYVRTIRDTGALPNLTGQIGGAYHQTPLYYLLLVPIATLLPDDDFDLIDGALNPFYGRQIDIAGNDNTNLYLHRRAETFPYTSETARAVHLMRLVSIVLGAATVVVAYRIYGLLWAHHPARRVAATAVVAFWPQFLYISSVINNDNLLIFLATFSLYLILRLIKRGVTRRATILLGITLGALALTKITSLALAALIGLFFAVQPRLWRYGVLAATIALAVGGWWYLRNLTLYNDPVGLRAIYITWPQERIDSGITPQFILSRLPWTYQTFWARFGAGAVAVGNWLHLFFNLIVMLVIVGWLVRIGQALYTARRVTGQTAFLCGFAIIWLVNVVYLAGTAWSGNQGRYLLPGITVWAAVIVLGLEALPILAVGRRLPRLVAGLWAAAALACLILYFIPAYQARPLPATIEHPLNLRYGDTAELIGISSPVLRVHPGETLTVSLYWRALAPSQSPLYSYLHSENALVRIDSFPGNGHLLSTEFEPGQTWAETYTLTIPPDTEPQRVHQLLAGLYDPAAGEVIAADGETPDVLPLVGRLAIAAPPQPLQPAYPFGSAVGLEAPTITVEAEGVRVCLTWDALSVVGADYQVFVHLLTADHQLIAQVDQPPRAGQYPTSVWSPGERISDCLLLPTTQPLDGALLQIGMYNAQTGARLPIQDSSGSRLPDDVLVLPITNPGE